VIAVLLVAVVAGVLTLTVIVAVFTPGASQGCEGMDGAGEPIGPSVWSLGGVGGSGVTSDELDRVRSSRLAGSVLTTGVFRSTAYGPPWGGLQGSGDATAGGLVLGGAAPKRYVIATDPRVIALGQWVYAWPNPFGWRGPFLAADTGGRIKGRTIDFYDWRGRAYQTRWNRQTTVTGEPPAADARSIDVASPPSTASSDAAGVVPGDGCAAMPLSSESGVRVGQIARAFLGKDARRQAFAGFDPPTTQVSWCAWFSTNVWRLAGVPIEVSDFSGHQYAWAQRNGTLFKGLGSPPRGSTPPVGSALMYGSGPQSTGTSQHVNLVDAVNPDGTFMLTGGNQDSSRVTREGPCRLSRTEPARDLRDRRARPGDVGNAGPRRYRGSRCHRHGWRLAAVGWPSGGTEDGDDVRLSHRDRAVSACSAADGTADRPPGPTRSASPER
jgi:3D (Asp-Asp-Asp) domain-containing protein